MRDDGIPNTIVRTSTIPEELGRISVIFLKKIDFIECYLIYFLFSNNNFQTNK